MEKSKLFMLPNQIILDKEIGYSAKKIAAVLYCHKSSKGIYTKSLAQLSQLAHQSVPTVRKSLKKLEKAGYISSQRNYTYARGLKRIVYSQTTYCCLITCDKSFTRIPQSLLTLDIKPTTFSVVLYILFQMGNSGRAWPKISQIGTALNICRASVCRALAAIRAAGILMIQHCIKQNKAYTSNSYFCQYSTQQPIATLRDTAVFYVKKKSPLESNCVPVAGIKYVISILGDKCKTLTHKAWTYFKNVQSHFLQTKHT